MCRRSCNAPKFRLVRSNDRFIEPMYGRWRKAVKRTFIVTAASAALSPLIASCNVDLGTTAIDMPLSPTVGIVRTQEFVARKGGYDVFIGLGAIPTDQATCLAARPPEFGGKKLQYPDRPCKALTPPLGATSWTVTKEGIPVAHGGVPGFPWQWGPSSVGDGTISWIGLGWFSTEPGSQYVVEVTVHPSAVSLDQVHPRLKIESPWSGP
jgi:hypothetical protein